jgi:hypothetical protein
MATTNQISGSTAVSPLVDRYLGDDWEFTFELVHDDGDTDFSSYTWTASLITEPSGVYTATAISGGNGSVDSSDAATGTIVVTVDDSVTSALTPDMDAPDVATSTTTTFATRVALMGTVSSVTTTFAIVPVRIIRR